MFVLIAVIYDSCDNLSSDYDTSSTLNY